MSINGGTLASDEAFYQHWLRNPASVCIYLVELDYVGDSGGSPQVYTLKLATAPYPPYRNVVRTIPSFSRQIGDNFTGATTASYGEIELDNSDGLLDSWITLNISGRKVRLFQGDPAWPRERFRLVAQCLTEIVTSSDWDGITIRLRAQDFGSNLPIQTNLIPTTTTQTVANVVIPKAFGTVFNIDPAVLDATNQVYQWNDGATTSVTDVRDGGVSFRTNQVLVTSVSGNIQTCPSAHGFVAGTRVRSDVGSLPSGAGLNSSICHNGDIFLAVGSSTVGAISKDGLKWSTITLPFTADWRKVVWNGSLFCGIAFNNGNVGISYDGTSWQTAAISSTSYWQDLAWNGKIFCAISTSSSNKCSISPDGFNWTAITLPLSADWTSIVWNGTVFCVIAYNSSSCLTSLDGITWQTNVSILDYWVSLAWNGITFCAVASNSWDTMTSPDGVVWTSHAHALATLTSWRQITWNGSVFCALAPFSAASSASPDGVNWTLGSTPSGNYLAQAWNGSFLCATSIDSAILSTDGINWTSPTSTPPTPLALSTDYWVSATGLTPTAFQLSATRGGPPITLTSATTGGAWIGYHWTAGNTTGKLYLDSKPAGKLTMDGVAPFSLASDVIMNCLQGMEIDAVSKAKFDVTCPQTLGIYIKDRRNRIDVALDVIKAVNGWYGMTRAGYLRFGRVEATNVNAVFKLSERDMLHQSMAIGTILMPKKGVRVGYAKNYTVQSSGLFAACSTDNVAYYSAAEKIVTGTAAINIGSADVSNNLLAVIPDVDSSLLAIASDAAAEATRLNNMYKGYGAVFTCEVGLIGTEIDIGDVVNVTNSRYGLSGGVNMTVVYCEDKPATNTVALKLYVYLGTSAPGQL